MKAKTRLERFGEALPVFFGYGILTSTWIAFIFGLSIHQTFSNRNQTLHFIAQQIIGNSLFGLAFASLVVASNRNPGAPNPSLAPSIVKQDHDITADPEKRNNSRTALSPITTSLPENDDDIPLRHLRNPQWVKSRIGKDRPSPLPVASSRQQVHTQVMASSSGSNSSGDFNVTSVSPFPLNVSPFVPLSASEAGEDMDELRDDRRQARFVEGKSQVPHRPDAHEREEDVVEGDDDHDRLLGGRPGRRTIMAKSNTGERRWCKKCDNWKPDRCHHCSYCRRCVLKMDHHCIWIGTCVGFDNYKPFWLFLTYSTALALYVAVEAGYETYRFFQDPDDFYRSPAVSAPKQCEGGRECSSSNLPIPEIDLGPVAYIVLAVLGIFFGLAVGSLMGFHWWLAFNNVTTLERLTHSYPSVLLDDDTSPTRQTPRSAGTPMSSSRGVNRGWKPDHLLTRGERTRLRREAREINVYDKGWRRNLREIFGDRSVFLAFLPWVRAHHQFDRDAGHFFEVDETKLDRLRTLTRELRLSDDDEAGYYSEEYSESGNDSEVDTQNDIRLGRGDNLTPMTANSGINGDDEDDGSDEDEDTDKIGSDSRNRTQVKWFEA